MELGVEKEPVGGRRLTPWLEAIVIHAVATTAATRRGAD